MEVCGDTRVPSICKDYEYAKSAASKPGMHLEQQMVWSLDLFKSNRTKIIIVS